MDGRETYDYRDINITLGKEPGSVEVTLGRTRSGLVINSIFISLINVDKFVSINLKHFVYGYCGVLLAKHGAITHGHDTVGLFACCSSCPLFPW